MRLTSSQGRAPGLLRGPWDSGVPAGQRPQWKARGQAPSGAASLAPASAAALPRACDVQALPVPVHLYGRCTDMFPFC